jgi:hypothetical protein
VVNDNNEISSINERLGPPRLTRLDPDVDAEVLRLAEATDRPVAAVLRRLVRRALRAKRAA